MQRPDPLLRLRAWLVTGPIGHFVAGALDWAGLVVRIGRARLRGHDPFGP